MQQSSAAAKLIRQMFRQDSHHNMQDEMQVWLHRMQLSLQFCCEIQRSEPSKTWALRDPLRAVLGARRPIWRLSWALRGPSRGHLERQEVRLQAVLSARRAVRRLFWSPGGPSTGRLGRQEARMQVLLQFCCEMQVLRSWQQEARLQHRQATIAEFLYRYTRVDPCISCTKLAGLGSSGCGLRGLEKTF